MGNDMPTINETLGQYSDLFMLLAAFVYAVAFIAFAWDLAKSSKLIREIDAATLEAEKKVLVAAGAGKSAPWQVPRPVKSWSTIPWTTSRRPRSAWPRRSRSR